MKIDRLETHDRFLEFQKQKDYISKGCQDCINNRPEEFGNLPFYIFAHCRTHEDGFTKRLIWEPRLTKPSPQTNSMLFKAYPPGDTIKIIWMIPDRSMWDQYKKGNITENQIVMESIHNFQFNRDKLSEKEPDDLSDDRIDSIYEAISLNASRSKLYDRLYTIKPETSEASLTS